ncbi:MAG: putative sulfate exporter family transporter [Archaeoglobaceae archaeon]
MAKTDWSSLWKKEDWWAFWIGMLLFFLCLAAAYGFDVMGWAANAKVWVDPAKSIDPASKTYAYLGPVGSLIVTYIVLLVMMSIGAKAMGWDLKKYVVGFTIIYFLTWLCWWIGHYAYIASTDPAKDKIPWSLKLSGEFGFILALILGLLIGNFAKGFAAKLKEAARPEWYIKTAIVLLGATVGIKAIEIDPRVLANFLFRGVCAIVEAYLIYWALVYWVARRYFGFTREWAAPLASGISICGVSAAIATGAAIRARPVVPIMVASLVVIFAAVELIILPFAAAAFLWHQPLVAGAWMGLAVKTDGAAAASGAIVDSLITGLHPEFEPLKGWILNATIVTKIFIDIFIGVWAFLLAIIWVYWIDKRPGEKVAKIEIWYRFPKFVIGYFLTFLILLWICSAVLSAATAGLPPEQVSEAAKKALAPYRLATSEMDVFRKLYFAITFFSIGLISDFATLRKEGIGKLALVYVVCLFGFIIWIALVISWLFFHDIHVFFLR